MGDKHRLVLDMASRPKGVKRHEARRLLLAHSRYDLAQLRKAFHEAYLRGWVTSDDEEAALTSTGQSRLRRYGKG